MSDEEKTEAKKTSVVTICSVKIVDGHFETDCVTKKVSHELAELLEKGKLEASIKHIKEEGENLKKA